jgi:signal transduction histidine kinase
VARRGALFRFAFGVPLLGALLTGLLFVPIYQEAVDLIRAELRASVERDSWDLEVEFHEGGLDALKEAIVRRTDRDVDLQAIYGLREGRNIVAGNVQNWPNTDSDDDWLHFELIDGRAEGQIVTLFGERELLVARRSPLPTFDEHLATQLALAVLGVFALSLIASLMMSRRLRRRITRLGVAADAIRRGDLSRRLELSPARDEIDGLAERFNTTFADLERMIAGVRQVGGHLAHDLRRPLQALKRRLESLLAAAPDAATETELLACVSELDDLLETFNALLRLGKLEAGGYALHLETIDLGQVIRDAVEFLAPLAEQSGRELHLEVDSVPYEGDRHLWFQLAQNLISNAIVHGQGAIDVRLNAEEFSVRDYGPNLDIGTILQMGQPYFRADRARSAPGVGIGMALARAIADAHGGDMLCENANPGLHVRVRLKADQRDR